MKKIFVSVLLGFSMSAGIAQAKPTAISDSLVNNLSCSSLSVNSILSKIRPDAFSQIHHMPLRNWGFRSGLVNLGACWGMGSTQRKLFYLMRLNEKNASKPNVTGVLDMVRGARVSNAQIFLDDAALAYQEAHPEIMRANESPLSSYSVIPVPEQSIKEAYYHNTGTSFMDYMFRGVGDRNIRTEIERSQELHFFRAGNVDMGAGSGPRSTSTNRETLRALIKNIDSKRLTLINLRLKMRIQHIVIPKSYVKDSKGNVWINAYDSNQPETDKRIYYSKATGHFYSPEIMGILSNEGEGANALGVFIVDEAERAQIENSLLKYYQKRCQ